ncbi:MAG: hypothetical protein ISR65_19370 [Bacteriovoracaceae bacterium]|nr:hypothetical protein [Bacteriovoracaceae bacterium]
MNEQWNDKVCANLIYRESSVKSQKEVFITLVIKEAMTEIDQIALCFQRVASFLKKNEISILQEKVYGLSSHMQQITSVRNEQYATLNETPPVTCTFIDGKPCMGGVFAGIQIIGVVSKDSNASLSTITHNQQNIGVTFENEDYKKVFLSGISHEALSNNQNELQQLDLYSQVKAMFHSSKEILAEQKVNFDQVLRTWIYFPRILDWYGEFNRARTDCFKELGLISKTRNYLPASTGIQGKRTDSEECFMDVLGFVSKNPNKVKASVMRNSRQNEADEYGSSFSRGISIDSKHSSTMYISGTASINNDGETIYHQDRQGQMIETLLDIAALLETKNGKLSDIVMATAYCKDESMYKNYKRIVTLLELENIPMLPVYADVCRDELLFEIDSIAVKDLETT